MLWFSTTTTTATAKKKEETNMMTSSSSRASRYRRRPTAGMFAAVLSLAQPSSNVVTAENSDPGGDPGVVDEGKAVVSAQSVLPSVWETFQTLFNGINSYDDDMSIYRNLVQNGGLEHLFNSCDGGALSNKTIFIPNDAAFKDLISALGMFPPDLAGEPYDIFAERAVMTNLFDLLQAYGGYNSTAADIVRYHVVDGSGALDRDAVQESAGGAGLTTLHGSGTPVTVTADGKLQDLASDVPGKLPADFINNPARDILTCNGFVHVINSVLIPFDDLTSASPTFQSTPAPLKSVQDFIKDRRIGVDATPDNFGTFNTLLQISGMEAELGSCPEGNSSAVSDKTVFLPTDAAFLELIKSVGYPYDPDKPWDTLEGDIVGFLAPGLGDLVTTVKDIVKYHIVTDGAMTQDEIKSKVVLTTLHGSGTTILASSDGLLRDRAQDLGLNPRMVDDPKDILTCNGYVQAIDRVLIPFEDLSTKPFPPSGGEPAEPLEADDLPSASDVLGPLDGNFTYDGNDTNFQIFASMLQLGYPVEPYLKCDSDVALRDATVLAPTDGAFRDLAASLGYAGGYDEAAIGTFVRNQFIQLGPACPSPPCGPIEAFASDVVRYHVIDSASLTPEMFDALAGTSLSTFLAGKDVVPNANGTITDLATNLPNPTFITPKNVITCNGLIQAIDKVLMPKNDIVLPTPTTALPPPPATTTTMMMTTTAAPLPSASDVLGPLDGNFAFDDDTSNFQIFASLLNAGFAVAPYLSCDSDVALRDATVLAPTDGAFLDLATTLGYDAGGGGYDESAVGTFVRNQFIQLGPACPSPPCGPVEAFASDVVRYHVVTSSAPLTRDMIVSTAGTSLPTLLAGKDVVPNADGTVSDLATNLPDPMLVDPRDVATCNGLVQAIDRVLMPKSDIVLPTPTTTAPPPPVTTTTPPATATAAPGNCCMYDTDCVADAGKAPLSSCGNAYCNHTISRCQFDAWNSSDYCYDNYYTDCGGNDTLCDRGPANSAGTCTGWMSTECEYTWCPTTPPPPPPPILPTPPPGVKCCAYDADCVADAGMKPLDACGNAYCNTTLNLCQFNAWNSSDYCYDEYYTWCGGDDALCDKGPMDGVGTCTGYMGGECIYSWCPGNAVMTTTTAATMGMTTSPPPPPPPATPPPGMKCCDDETDCVADVGRLSLSLCGNVWCNENHMCVFNAWNSTSPCYEEYYTWCEGIDGNCTSGPMESMGTCTGWEMSECVYTWCPGGD